MPVSPCVQPHKPQQLRSWTQEFISRPINSKQCGMGGGKWSESGGLRQPREPQFPLTSLHLTSRQGRDRVGVTWGAFMGQAWKGLHIAATCTSPARPQSRGPAGLQGKLEECGPVLFQVGKRNGVGWTASQCLPLSTSQLCRLGQRPCFSGPQFPALKNKANPTSPAGREEPVQ